LIAPVDIILGKCVTVQEDSWSMQVPQCSYQGPGHLYLPPFYLYMVVSTWYYRPFGFRSLQSRPWLILMSPNVHIWDLGPCTGAAFDFLQLQSRDIIICESLTPLCGHPWSMQVPPMFVSGTYSLLFTPFCLATIILSCNCCYMRL
jgi:hypothetical protein